MTVLSVSSALIIGQQRKGSMRNGHVVIGSYSSIFVYSSRTSASQHNRCLSWYTTALLMLQVLSGDRQKRWRWLLAMMCYRFALRISHHLAGRTPDAAGNTTNNSTSNSSSNSNSSNGSSSESSSSGSSSSSSSSKHKKRSASAGGSSAQSDTPVTETGTVQPEGALRHELQQRRRRLLYSSLELLSELADMGGGRCVKPNLAFSVTTVSS
jgi:hypothetical protein